MPADKPTKDLLQRAELHAALGDPVRLRIVDALSQSDLSPSELGELTRLASNLLAHHLEVLEAVQLIERTMSHGDRRRRYVRLRHGKLAQLGRSLPVEASSVLFVCTANSARSQLAAAMWNADHAVVAASAGTDPAPDVHPQAKRAGVRRGLDLAHARPTSLDEISEPADVVVTVCDQAHEWLRGHPIRARRVLHWSIADPARSGTARAFDRVANELETRIGRLAPTVVPAAGSRR